ncbi:MAG TPA: NUDIX hydrolase [Streptosporangiaceae bacterium]|nr:NUDIX hydrolase [Streptosporangiaceae bacterium]
MSFPDDTQLRCSAVIVRQQSVLLVRRARGTDDDWVLPGGTPRAGESMAACARREVLEETGLHVDPSRVAFVLEVLGPDSGLRTLDIVFTAAGAPDAEPHQQEPGLAPVFVPVEEISGLDLRPPLAGHIRGMINDRGRQYSPYLAKLVATGGTPGADKARSPTAP